MQFPRILPVHQTLPQPTVSDVASEVRQEWESSGIKDQIKPGARVAVGVGSRGIANLFTIVRTTLDVLKEWGADPFVVAAMGSHGGANAQGQRELLAEYDISEEKLGVTVKTDMDAVQIGTNAFGEPIWWDKNALGADAVLTISRIKAHTDFRGKFESGILKMLVIGLGKRDGASQHHRWGFRGLRDILPETGKVILEKTPFVAGLAILENAQEQTGMVRVVKKDEVMEEEPKLLETSKEWMGRLPFEDLDVLVIGEIGKNYSGAGMDPNVIGRLLIEGQPEFESPRITRICALDVSPESHGNAVGVGLADLTTQRLIDAIDPVPFRMNTLTSCFLWRSKLPLAFPNDRECIQSALETCWQPKLEEIRLAVIPNTLEVADLWISESLKGKAEAHPHLEIKGAVQDLSFDENGNLRQPEMFPHAVCGRRAGASGS